MLRMGTIRCKVTPTMSRSMCNCCCETSVKILHVRLFLIWVVPRQQYSSNAMTRARSSGRNGRPVGGGPLTRSHGFGSVSSSCSSSLSSSSLSPFDFSSKIHHLPLSLTLAQCHSAIHIFVFLVFIDRARVHGGLFMTF